jgi:hypothetical protein
MHPIDPVAAGLMLVIGLLLVFLGRRLFWLFVGAIGFLAGVQYAPILAPGQPGWVLLLIAILLGVIGAVLATLLQRVVVAVAGWLAGGAVASRLAVELGYTSHQSTAIAFLVGAILLAIAFSLLFDWALIGMTAVVGALMSCDAVNVAPALKGAIAIVLAIVGIAVQARGLIRSPQRASGAR